MISIIKFEMYSHRRGGGESQFKTLAKTEVKMCPRSKNMSHFCFNILPCSSFFLLNKECNFPEFVFTFISPLPRWANSHGARTRSKHCARGDACADTLVLGWTGQSVISPTGSVDCDTPHIKSSNSRRTYVILPTIKI